MPITEELETEAGHEVAVASVYAAPQRLEDKGAGSSRFGDPTPERGGRAKKFFTVAGKGPCEAQRPRRRVARSLHLSVANKKGLIQSETQLTTVRPYCSGHWVFPDLLGLFGGVRLGNAVGKP